MTKEIAQYLRGDVNIKRPSVKNFGFWLKFSEPLPPPMNFSLCKVQISGNCTQEKLHHLVSESYWDKCQHFS